MFCFLLDAFQIKRGNFRKGLVADNRSYVIPEKVLFCVTAYLTFVLSGNWQISS
ncbi:Uncharacterized protein dnm_085230 [Desulfonema magnum]|uniref:Uncharacterized protein n=1 Tax=Desulfonema magnum TaxID=45655 RepID=A0A975GTS8_9BACT|nr:Uncharacterized protein dnm_085230 [Desulfonema magnum]